MVKQLGIEGVGPIPILHTADFRWNQACIVDLGAGNFPIWRVWGGGGGKLRKISSLWYNLTKKVIFLPVAGFGIFGPHKILGGTGMVLEKTPDVR